MRQAAKSFRGGRNHFWGKPMQFQCVGVCVMSFLHACEMRSFLVLLFIKRFFLHSATYVSVAFACLFFVCANIYALICVTGIASYRDRETCAEIYFQQLCYDSCVLWTKREIKNNNLSLSLSLSLSLMQHPYMTLSQSQGS